MTLGQKIRQLRIDKGLTQKELVGEHITRNMLSKIENDSATPSVRTLEYLASRLGVSAGYFMTDFSHSDGTSPDGLDEMRAAYREGRYQDCITLLESAKTQGTTDEGYLLHALSALGAAHEAVSAGDTASAREYADAADYYNKEGLYYSAAIDAEMSLILSECALMTDISEFEQNAREYERAVKGVSFSLRFDLARAEYLLRTGETELASKILDAIVPTDEHSVIKLRYLEGLKQMYCGDQESARTILHEVETRAGAVLLPSVYAALERCCRELEDYKEAYKYASMQLKNRK